MDVVLLFVTILLSQLYSLLLDPIFYSADFILNSQMQDIMHCMMGVCIWLYVGNSIK